MTPDEFYQYVDREFNLHRENGIRDLNEGTTNPGDRYTAALTISEHMVHHVFGNTDHFQLWCGEHGFRMIAREGYGHYRIQREYRAERRALQIPINQQQVAHFDWRDTPINLQDGDTLTIDYPANNTEEQAQAVEWTLTDVFHRPNQDTVYVGLDNGVPTPNIRDRMAQRMAERVDRDLLYGENGVFAPGPVGAEGGYIVPDDIAGFILGNHTEQPSKTLDFTKLIYEGSGIHDLHKRQEEAHQARQANQWARSIVAGA